MLAEFFRAARRWRGLRFGGSLCHGLTLSTGAARRWCLTSPHGRNVIRDAYAVCTHDAWTNAGAASIEASFHPPELSSREPGV
jgi:hypothetical protein